MYHQVARESLCIALCDESALVGGDGQHGGRLERQQLARRARRAVDLQLLARATNLLPVELGQRLTEDLGQTKAELATNAVINCKHVNHGIRKPAAAVNVSLECRYGLSVERGLLQLGVSQVPDEQHGLVLRLRAGRIALLDRRRC